MARYVSLLKFTEKGSAELKESTNRAHEFDALAKQSGVTVEGQYWSMGCCDGILILQADTEAKILRLLTELTSRGNVRSESLQAFTDKEFDAIVNA